MAGFTFDEFLGNGGASVGTGKGFTFDAFLGGGKKEEPVAEPVADEGIVGKAQTLMTGEEARSAGNMGGITKSAIEAQMNGGPTAYADDGSVKNWLGNLWNAISYNTSGKLTARNAEMNNQDILRGTVRKNGQEIPLTELDDGELDYLADAAGWNGAGAYFKRFLGPWVKPGNGLLQEWDRTEGVKYADEAERKAARVRYAQDIARMNVEQQESERNAAATELEERPKSFGAGAVGGLVTNGAYMLPFMMPGAHGVLAGVIEGLDRAQELLSDRYETDEDGNIRVGAERDSTERAIVKGAARGVIAPLIETVGGEIVAKGLGKAASMTIGKVPLFQKIGGKIAESAAGKAVSKWIESMSRFGKYTGLQSMPVEIIEELEDQVIDAATALDKRDSETEGDVLGRAAGAFADFMKPQSLLDLTESMLLIQMIGGGAAAASDRARARVPDLILERVAGLKKSEIKNYTPEEKWAAYKSYVDKLSEEEIAEKFGKGAKAVNELTAIIRKGASFDTKKSIEEYGETPHEFEAQTEVDAEGKATPKFRKSVHTGVDGVEREVDEMFDETAQVGIADLGEGKYEVRDAMHPDRTRTTDDFNDAVSTANEWALDNQKRRLDNRVKRELAEQLTQGEDAPFKRPAVFADTVRDVYAAFEAGLRNAREAQLRGEGDGTFMGMQSLGQIFQTDENGEVAMPPRFRAGDEAFTAHDGTKVVVLDNVRDAAHLRRLLSHEAGHSAGRGDPKARVEMLKRISPNSELGREIARELALNKKLGEKYTEEQVREEAFANWLEARGHNPSIMQRITNKVFGKVGQLNDADLEVMAAKLEAEEANGSGEGVMFLDADYADEQSRGVEQAETPAAPTEAENLGENSRASSGAQEEANDETGRGADEEQAAEGEEGAERVGQREEAQAGEGPAEVPEAAGEKADERVVEASAEARQPKSETRKKVEEKAWAYGPKIGELDDTELEEAVKLHDEYVEALRKRDNARGKDKEYALEKAFIRAAIAIAEFEKVHPGAIRPAYINFAGAPYRRTLDELIESNKDYLARLEGKDDEPEGEPFSTREEKAETAKAEENKPTAIQERYAKLLAALDRAKENQDAAIISGDEIAFTETLIGRYKAELAVRKFEKDHKGEKYEADGAEYPARDFASLTDNGIRERIKDSEKSLAQKKAAKSEDKAKTPEGTGPKGTGLKGEEAIKLVEGFASKDDTRAMLKSVYHDHDKKVVVATDGRALIATKHGYDPNAKWGNEYATYPDWAQVVPKWEEGKKVKVTELVDNKRKTFEKPVVKFTIDPKKVSEICKTAIRLRDAVLPRKIDGEYMNLAQVLLPLGNGEKALMNAEYLKKMADAMVANGMTEVLAIDGLNPLMAKNDDTTIVAMPMRYGDGAQVTIIGGRGKGFQLILNGETGRVISAPARSGSEKTAKVDDEIDAAMEQAEKPAAPKAAAPKSKSEGTKAEKPKEKKPAAPRTPSIKMKDEAAEKEVQRLEDEFAALFKTPEFDILDGDGREGTVKASYTLDEDRLGGALGFGRGSVPDRAMVDAARVVLGSQVPGAEASALVWNGKITLEAAQGLFSAFNTDAEVGRLFARVFPVAQALGVEYSLEQYTGRRSGDPKGMPLGYYEKGKIKLFSNVLFRKRPQIFASTILHETIHGVSAYALDLVDGTIKNPKAKITPELRAAAQEVIDIYEANKGWMSGYGATNAQEMLAEIANPKFREELKKGGVWQRLWAAIGRMFGFGTKTAYDRAVDALGKFVENYDREVHDSYMKDANRASLDEDLLAANAKYLNWAKKWRLDPEKEKNQKEWARKNGVSFKDPEFDPDTFQKRAGAVARLVKVYKDGGAADFKTLATRLAESFPEKFGAMKPHLRGLWNYIAEQMGLEEVSKQQADEIYGIIQGQTTEVENDRRRVRREVSEGESTPGGSGPVGLAEGQPASAEGQQKPDGLLAGGRVRGQDTDGRVDGGRTGAVPGRAQGVAEEEASGGEETRGGEASGGNGTVADSVRPDVGEREASRDSSEDGRGSGAKVKKSAKKAADSTKANPFRRDFVMTKAVEEAIVEKSPIKRIRQNVAAIKLIRELAQKEFVATPDEQATLAKYVGWGGLSEMFTWDYERAWNLERDGAAKSEVESIARKGKFGVAGYEAYKELRQTLNDDEYRSARASTTTAFYTPIDFVRVLHDALRNIGVKGGRFLGPSAGTGNFASAEGEYEKPVNWQFVEKDQVTGMILKALFPNQRVNISGFEETKFPDGFFDFAVDNVPYADVSMTDRSLSPQSFKIHDYFFAKTLAKLRTGGVMAFLTSTGTLDKTSPILRKFLTEHGGRIVGAVRLPNGFFSENAGTDVASDLVIVQKVEGRPDNSAFEKAVEYGKTTEWVRRKGQVEKPLTYNGYFKENPGQVVGKMEVASGQFGPTIKYTMPEKDMLFDIGGAIARAFDGIDKDALLKSVTVSVPEERAPVYDDEGLRQGNITLKDGKPYIKSGEMLEPVSMPNDRALTKELTKRRRTGKQIVEGLIDLRKAMRGVIDAQMRGIDDEGLKPLLATLNETYDGFVKKNGTLHDKWVMPFVMLDKADGNRMLALERTVKDESGKSKVVKSDIFTKRVISLGQRATKAGSPREALIISYSETGGINIPRIAELLDMDGEEAVDALKKGGDVFENPQTGLLEPSWAYLSGRVRAKLAAARAAVEAGEESFRANVEALEKVQPPMVKLEDTEIKFGATWVDTECMKDFLKDAFGSDYMRITLAKSELTGDWHVEFDRVMNESPWGETSWGAQEFIKRVLNHGSMEHIVTDPVNKKKYLDEKRTEANKLAADKLHSAFSQFILSSDKWAGPMYERYNAVMTDNVAIKLPNNILPFRAAGMSEETLRMLFEDGDTSKPKKGREYQSDVIARGVLGGNSLCLAHCVGAGKTLEMQAIGMLGRRLGMFKKSMYVVPNHMLDQFVNEFTRAFPDANLLKMTAEDVKPANRRAFFAQVANGDWDAIVVKHSTFSQKLGMSKQYQEDFMIQQKKDLMMAITAMKVSGDRISVKQGEKMLARLEDKLKKLGNAEGKDKELVPFEELGVDQLFVDEAHNFKGMPITTRQGRTSGLSGSDSQRAEDMHMKTQYVQSLHGGTRGVVFATGTPLSNAPVIEAYVMLKYLAPQKLAEQGLSHFDDFVAAFGRITVESKFDLDGKSVKEKDAVTAFVNIPEMMNLFKSVVDIVNSDQLNIPRPKPKYHMIDVDMTDAQAKIMEMVAARSSTPPSKEERNKYLTLTRIAKAACLTPRLLGFEDGGNKIVRAVSEVKKVYDDTADNRGTQLIFTDIFNESGAPENARYLTELRSVLKSSSGSTDFNLNEEIRDLLVAAGIPKDEIAIIQDIDKSKGDKDANKEALFAKVRAGEVRILIGSRQKMGEGTNVQERLAAIHLLHPGWKPSEDEQAIGRIIRNGNMFKEGQIFYYLTKGNEKIGSYETKNHQLIGAKSKLIDQVMHNDESVRSVEMDESAMDRDMLMGLASGNKALMELIDVKKRAHKLELNTESTLTSARRNKDKAEANARVLERRREEFAKEQEGVKEWREKNDGKPFVLTTPDGRTIEKVKDMAELVAGEVTKQLTKDRFERKERTVLGSINGVEMVLAYDRWGDEKFKVAVPLIGVEREINYSGFVPDFTQGAMTAFKTRILETVKPETAKAQKAAMADMERQAKKMSADADKLQKDYEAMRGDLVKLRSRQAELERAVTPLMVQAVEDRSLAAYGNWAIHKDRVDAGQGLGYTAVREKDGKRVHAPSVKELIPLMDAEDFASPGNAAAKTEDLQKHLPANEKGERARVDTMPVEEVNFKRPEFDILSRHGETDREYIERVTSVYPALGRKDARRMGEVVAASAVQGALQGMATGERLRRPLGSTDRRSSIVIGRTTAKVYVPLTDKGAIDDVLRWRFVSNINFFGDELGVRKVNRVAVDEAGDAYVELETDSLRPVRENADEYFTRNGWTRGGVSSGYDGLGPVFYEKNGVQISTDELKFVRNDKTGRIVPFMADIYDRTRGMDKRANNAPVQGALFKTPELYTGSAADFDKPSLAKVGTGQGSQVYGWGLYATTVRDVAEGYKWENLKGGILLDGVRMSTFGNTPYALVANQGIGATSLDNVRERLVAWLNGSRTQRGRAQAEEALEFFDENRSRMQVITGNVYEQTFFTDRAPGDESHLLKWYEPVTEEQKQWIADELNKSEDDPKMKWVVTEDGLKLNNPYSPDYPIKTGADAYQFAQTQAAVLAKSKYPRDYPRLASELLARAGIDGIKYPVDSYGKTVKDGNKVGWNYVSFRDDNIRVDHKWRNGEAMFKTPELDPAEAEYAEREDKTPTEKDKIMFGYTKADIDFEAKVKNMELPPHVVVHADEIEFRAGMLLSNLKYMALLSDAVHKYGRPTSTYENVALGKFWRMRVERVNELQKKYDELATIPEDELKSSPELADELKSLAAELAAAKRAMRETSIAKKSGSTESARALWSNKLLHYLDDDYTYAGILNTVAEAYDGLEKIPPELEKEIKALADKFAELDEKGREVYKSKLKAFSDKIVDNIKGGMKMRRSVERRTGDEAKRVTRNYNDALAQIEVSATETGGTLIGLSDQQYPVWGKWLRAIGEFHCFENPNITEEEVIKAIVEDISPFMNAVDENQVRNALTGFGHNFRQSRYDSQRLMNDLKSQSLKKLQLKHMDETGTLPPSTGLVRDEPSDETRNLAKQVQAKKAEIPDAERDAKHLKGVLDSAKTRVRNRIADMERAIETGERIPRRERSVVEDVELQQLKKRKAELQAVYDEMFKTESTMTEAQRIAAAEKALGRTLEAAMEDLARAQAGDFSKRPRREGVTSTTIEVLRDRVREVRESIMELKRAKYEFGMTPDEVAALNARKIANREKAMMRLAEKIERGDTRTNVKPQPPMTKEQQAIYDELAKQMKKGRQKLADMRLAALESTKPDWWLATKGYANFLVSAQRALRATMDFSAVLRQAARITLSHPTLGAKAFGKAWEAAKSEANLVEVNDAITADPLIQEAVGKYGLHLREIDAENARDVEMFHGMERNRLKLFGKEFAITDIPWFGELMLKSERHYLTYLNAVSAEMYTAIVSDRQRFPGGATPWQKKMVADMINVWNGSAAISKQRRQALQKAGLNLFFWAPQLAISRIQSAAGFNVWHPLMAEGVKNAKGETEAVSSEERRTLAKIGAVEYVRSTTATLALGFLLRWLFSDDDDEYYFKEASLPEKLIMLATPKIGNTTIDLSGGEASVQRLIYQIVAQEKRSNKGRLMKFGEYGSPTVMGVLGRFAEGKLAPWASTAIAMYTGKDYVGQEFTWKDAATNLAIPLSFDDIKDQFRQNGFSKSLVTAPLTILGAGGSTYDRYTYDNAVNRFLENKDEYGRVGRQVEVLVGHVRKLERKEKEATDKGQPPNEVRLQRIADEKERILKLIRENRK